MTVTETTSQSWGSRIAASFKGMIVGFALVVGSIGVLFWNEGRTIKRAQALSEGQSAVVTVDAAQVDAANDGKLVCVAGDVATDETLTDDEFGVEVQAIKLVRRVETYQWQEDQKSETVRKTGGSTETKTTYSYKKVWSEHLIDSSEFKEAGHENPSQAVYENKEFVAKNVSLGAFQLSDALIARLGPEEPFDPAKEAAQEAEGTEEAATVDPTAPETAAQNEPAALETAASAVETEIAAPAAAPTAPATQAQFVVAQDLQFSVDGNVPTAAQESQIAVDGNASTAPTSPVAVAGSVPTSVQTAPALKPFDNGFYLGDDPKAPKIGDVKITFAVVSSPRKATVVSQQNGESFVPFQAKTGEVELLENEISTSDKMFASAQKSNQTMGWFLRLIGFAAMFFGFSAIFKPLSTIADVLPIAGSIVGAGTSFVAFALSLALSLGTISIGWLFYRPLVGVPFLIGAIASLLWLFVKARKKAPKNA